LEAEIEGQTEKAKTGQRQRLNHQRPGKRQGGPTKAVSKPFIFVSCGQFTDAEKTLGKEIVTMVESITPLTAFFAEQVHDLNGLNNNILNALRNCAGFIAVIHPRGKIMRPDGSSHVRASVWIEQEIAIAAYIQSAEKRPLPVIAFIHESIGREGIRDLIHLNPIPFVNEADVLAALPERLAPWKTLTATGVRVELTTQKVRIQDGHQICQLSVRLINNSNERITSFDGKVRVPSEILKHWSTAYINEEPSGDPAYRQFRLSEQNTGHIQPRKTELLLGLDYCMKCASEAISGIGVPDATVQAQVWIENREYSAEKALIALRPAG
jgi:hypothetical protein